MKLQNRLGSQSQSSLFEKKSLPTVKFRPKVNNLVETPKTEMHIQYDKFQSERQAKESEKEAYARLRKIYAEGTRRLKNYQVPQALELFKNYIQSLVKEFGRDYSNFQNDYRQIIENVSAYALRAQQDSGNAELALMILMWAEDMTNPVFEFEEFPLCRCLVYNNLGCVYRRCGKLQAAMSSLERALEIVQTFGDAVPRRSITYLNITAVLSQMGIHDRALQYSYSALKECQTELTLFLRDAKSETDDAAYAEKLKYVGIAMHNIAVEEECCGQLETACSWYQKSFNFMDEHFGQADPLTVKFHDFLERAKQKAEVALQDSRKNMAKQLMPNRQNQNESVQNGKTLLKIGKRQLVRPDSQKTFYFRSQAPQSLQQSTLSVQQGNKSLQQQQQGQQQLVQSQTTPNLFKIHSTIQKPQDMRKQFNETAPVAQQPPNVMQTNNASQLTDLRQMGVLDWSDEDNNAQEEEEEVQDQLDLQARKQVAEVPQVSEAEQRESRLNFLKKMTVVIVEEKKVKQKRSKPIDENNPNGMQSPLPPDDSNFVSPTQSMVELNVKKHVVVIKIQAAVRMKLQMKRYRKMQDQAKQEKKMKHYQNSLIRIQQWMRKYVWNNHQRAATRARFQARKLIRNPKKELWAVKKMQALARRFLTRLNLGSRKQIIQARGRISIRLSQFEPIFWDDECHVVGQALFQNRLFWLKFYISKPHGTISIHVLPYEKRKCLKILKKGFSLKIPFDKFCLTLMLLDQYVEYQRNSISEDMNVTHNIETLLTLARHIMKPICRADQSTWFQLNKQNELVMEDFLGRVGHNFEQLIRIEENTKLTLLGFTDFVYNHQYVAQVDETSNKRKIPFAYAAHIPSVMANLLILQKYLRGYFMRNNVCTKYRRNNQTVLKQFEVSGPAEGSSKREYFHVFVVLCHSDLVKRVFCRRQARKHKSNKMPISELVSKQMGEPCRDNFLEIYAVVITPQGITLKWSDEGHYWITRESYTGKTKNRKTIKKLNAAAQSIQHMIRNYLLFKQMKVYNEVSHRQRDGKTINGDNIVSIVRKVIIQPNIKAYFMNFVLKTDYSRAGSDNLSISEASESSENRTHFKRQQIMQWMQNSMEGLGGGEKQSIQIYCKCLDRIDPQRIPVFSQDLFYCIKLTEMLGIAHLMLERARVESTRTGTLKLNVSNIEELQGIIINEKLKQQHDDKEFLKDDGLEARRIFNNTIQRKKILFRNTSVFDYVDQQQITQTYRNSKLSEDDKCWIKKIWRSWVYVRKKIAETVSKPKDVKYLDLDSITEYVREFKYISDYGFGDDPVQGEHNMQFLELRKDEEEQRMQFALEEQRRADDERRAIQQEEEKRVAFIAATQLQVYRGQCVVSMKRVTLTIVLNTVLDQVFITSCMEDNHQVHHMHIARNLLVPRTDMTLEFLQMNADRMIVKQMHLDYDGLYFVPESSVQEQLYEEFQVYLQAKAPEVSHRTPEGFISVVWLMGLKENASKRTIDILVENEQSMVLMATFIRNATFEIEFAYNLSDESLILTVYLIVDPKVRKFYVVRMHDLNLEMYVSRFPEKTTHEIKTFLQPFIRQVEAYLDVTLARPVLLTNFNAYRNYLRTIFIEQLFIPVQSKGLGVKQYVRKPKKEQTDMSSFHSTKKAMPPQLIAMQRHICNFEGRYIEIRFFLNRVGYRIHITIKELNTIDQNGMIVPQTRSTVDAPFLNKFAYHLDLCGVIDRLFMSTLMSSLNPHQQIEWSRIDPFEWVQLDTLRTGRFYVKLYAPLIGLVLTNLRIHFPSIQLMRVTFGKLNPVIVKVKTNANSNTTMSGMRSMTMIATTHTNFEVMMAALRIQNQFKRKKEQKKREVMNHRSARVEIKMRHLGNLVKRVYMRINGKLYLVLMYLRVDDATRTITFDLIPYTDVLLDRRDIKLRSRGLFTWNSVRMFNTGALSFYDYLLGLLYIQNGHVKIREEEYKVYGPNEKILPPKPKDDHPKFHLANHKEFLVHHSEEGIVNGYETIYNVIYTKGEKLSLVNLDRREENTVEVVVNLQRIRKLYPTLNTFDGDVMKLIGMQLIQGIRVDENGQVMIDATKINPSFLTITQNSLQPNPQELFQQNYDEPTTSNDQRQQYAQILAKKTTQFLKNKYLVVIRHIQRKITKILNSDVGKIFEEFEILFQVTSTSINNKQAQTMVWEFSPDEATTLTHSTQANEIARTLLQRTLVAQDKFIYLTYSAEDIKNIRMKNKNVILVCERGVYPIQHRFRNRVFLKNYNQYKKTVKSFKNSLGAFESNVHLFSAEYLRSLQQFIVLCYEDRSRRIQLVAWDVELFHKFEVEIPKARVIMQINIFNLLQYQNLLMHNKRIAVQTLVRFVQYNSEYLKFTPPQIETLNELFHHALGK